LRKEQAMRRTIIAGLAVLGLTLGILSLAEAQGVRSMGGGVWKGQTGSGQNWNSGSGSHHHRGPRVTDTYPNKVFIPRYVHPGYPVYPSHPIYPGYPRYPGYGYGLYGGYGVGGYGVYPEYSAPTYVYVPTPQYVYLPTPAPTSSAERQGMPGHWAYKWVPESANGTAWVPGYYDRDNVWVAGYYRKTAPGEPGDGSYQPYWVEGYRYP
jgi:hypothetical protein